MLKTTKTKWTELSGRTVVSFTQESTRVDAFTVTATPSGITFKGTMDGELQNAKDLDTFAKLIGDAWKDHLSLIPRISLTPSGH